MDESTDELSRLRATLKRIRQERLTWAMACECTCEACMTFDRTVAEPMPHEQELLA